MFGRLVDVVISTEDNIAIMLCDHTVTPNTLVCSGEIELVAGLEPPIMTLTIYNLSGSVRGAIASMARPITVTVAWGYEDEGGIMSTIFEGTLQRFIFKRKDAVTSETIFYVKDSGEFRNNGIIGKAYDDGTNYYDIARSICREGSVPIAYNLSERLKEFKVEGKIVVYGVADEILAQLADDCNMLYQTVNNTANFITKIKEFRQEVIVFNSVDSATNKVYSNSGLIGIPRLSNDGLEFECLINPRLSIYSLVLLDNSIISINQEGEIPGDIQLGAHLDPNGMYRVVKISTKFSNDGNESKMVVKALAYSLYDRYVIGS